MVAADYTSAFAGLSLCFLGAWLSDIWKGSWLGVGIEARQRGGTEYRLALETPFLVGSCRNVTVLPNDQAVFQMAGAIVLLDLPSHRLATLTTGRSPAVVLSKPIGQSE